MNAYSKTTAKANGTLPFNLGWKFAWQKFEIIGGPFDARHSTPGVTFGVCVRAERVPAFGVDVHLPIHDFSIPRGPDGLEETVYAVEDTFKAALDGEVVYVGCMGGWGRTGLFMALLAKVAGEPDPIEYVRELYTPKAVETMEQVNFVKDFEVTALRKRMMVYAWKARFRRLLKLSW